MDDRDPTVDGRQGAPIEVRARDDRVVVDVFAGESDQPSPPPEGDGDDAQSRREAVTPAVRRMGDGDAEPVVSAPRQ